MTEDSRNYMRGYGSFPEGAEPTEEIAAFGDSSAEPPTSRSSARPSIPSQPPTPAAARPSRPWSAPPPAFASTGTSHAGQMTTDGLSSPIRRPLYGGVRRATAEPPGDLHPATVEPPGDLHPATVEPPGDLHPAIVEPPSAVRRATVEPPGDIQPLIIEPPTDSHPTPLESAAAEQPQPETDYPVWPASVEKPEGHHPAPSPGTPPAPPWDPAATGWPDEPPANAASRPEAAAEEYAAPGSPPPGPFFAPTRPAPAEENPHEAHSGEWSHEATYPATGDWSAQPPAPGWQDPPSRRVTPSAPAPRPTRLFAGLVIGLIAGLLLFGTAGWFAGRSTAPTATPQTPAAPAKPTQGLFEQTQATLNATHFSGPNLAGPWLPYLANCARVTPVQADGEKARTRCTIDGMSAFFVEYKSLAERDKARAKLQPQVREASTLAPGVKPPGKIAEGNYVEYAYRLTEGGVTRTVAGIWWDDARRPIAAYLLAYWKDGLGERWEPMRDLWSRYA